MNASRPCGAVREGETLRLSTGALECRFLWNEGHLVGSGLALAGCRAAWPLAGVAPDCEFPGHLVPPADGRLEVVERPATAVRPEHVEAAVTTRLGTLQVKRVFRLYPGCPAIGCDLYLRGAVAAPWRTAAGPVSAPDNIESAAAARQGERHPPILHRLWLPHPHLDVACVRFFDVSDRCNNYVQTRRVQTFRLQQPLAGNLLLCRDRLADRALFLLKEAPCSDSQLASPGFDFIVRDTELQVVGAGLLPEDIGADDWTRGYGFALGISGGTEFDLLTALRDYQHRLRAWRPDRDEMVMLNTWGDRGNTARVDEPGVLREIAAGARLGASHLELDHGWESTQDPAKVWPLRLKNIWDTPHFWEVNPVRFPHGLEPCAAAARTAGIELCLWFNPSIEDDFAHWRDDANALIGLHRRLGVRVFKIDGVQMPTKRAELNLRRMLDAVVEETDGEAVFNLDITAGQRFSYHCFNAYGNYFVENRYTDWKNYYPHWTLRNLWQLSRYVPPRALQMEFLNVWRNDAAYAADDPLAPGRVPFDYAFATVMMAQPLAFFEAAQLPEAGFALAPLLRIYREHMAAIHGGTILPVGEEPSGTGWTGFQSVTAPDAGYVLALREWNEQPEAAIACWGLAGRRGRCTLIAGTGRDFAWQAGTGGDLRFHLPGPFSFALYRYVCE